MLDLTGPCCGSKEAVEFFENLISIIPEENKTGEFCDMYERSLNRFRYEAKKDIGIKKKIVKAVNKGYHDLKYCGNCGFSANESAYKYCPNCGTKYRCMGVLTSGGESITAGELSEIRNRENGEGKGLEFVETIDWLNNWIRTLRALSNKDGEQKALTISQRKEIVAILNECIKKEELSQENKKINEYIKILNVSSSERDGDNLVLTDNQQKEIANLLGKYMMIYVQENIA